MTHQLDDIITALNLHCQRATYGAVAELVGQRPRSLMRGRTRGPSNSWIVATRTGRPTGYAEQDVHPQLTSHENVLKTAEELAGWLASH